jgi:hypothetical protein
MGALNLETDYPRKFADVGATASDDSGLAFVLQIHCSSLPILNQTCFVPHFRINPSNRFNIRRTLSSSLINDVTGFGPAKLVTACLELVYVPDSETLDLV